MASSVVQFRIDDDLKDQAAEIFDKLGLDLSTAIRIFLKRSVAVRGLPFGMTLSNEEYTSDTKVMKLSASIMDKNDHVYTELANGEIRRSD